MTIGQTNPNAAQLVKEGIDGTYRLLTLLDTREGLPESSFRSFLSRPTTEAHLGENHRSDAQAFEQLCTMSL